MDKRGENSMSAEIWGVHRRLEVWGKWARDVGLLGYPTRSVTERAGEGGILAGSPRPPTELPDAVALTDTAVARLNGIDQGVVRVYYLNWAPPETLWQRCSGIRSLSNFRCVLTRARWRIRAHLEGLEVDV